MSESESAAAVPQHLCPVQAAAAVNLKVLNLKNETSESYTISYTILYTGPDISYSDTNIVYDVGHLDS